MTKQNPERLCRSCYEFDYNMNRRDGVSMDVLVECRHDEEPFFGMDEADRKKKSESLCQGNAICAENIV